MSLVLLQGVIECSEPDRDILRFDARLRLFPPFADNDFCPLNIKNTVLQSCYIRNTEWICGVAVYTGLCSYKCMTISVCTASVLRQQVFEIFAYLSKSPLCG
jgi:hypothetical protein